MTQQRSALEQKILAKAQATASEILKKAEGQAKSLLNNARSDADAQLSRSLKSAEGRAEMIRKEYEASGHLEAKLLLLRKKDELISRVMNQAWEQLKVKLKREDYRDIVIRLIREGLASLGLKEAVVTLGPNEKQVLQSDLAAVTKSVKLTLSPEALNSLGGVRVSDHACHVHYDNTWDARLERARAQIGVEVSEILFTTDFPPLCKGRVRVG